MAAGLLLFWLTAALVAGCRNDSDPTVPEETETPARTLLALGDSYTVGHGVPWQWNWPCQLADSLAAGGDTLQDVKVIATTGWTTRDLLDAVRDSLHADALNREYGLVTLMIGVNNQFQGLDLQLTASEWDTLAVQARQLAGGDPLRVLAFSIPDYGVTPVGQMFDAEVICDEIEQHNRRLAAVMADHGISVLDITTVSLLAGTDASLLARDGLHFSREMYRRWVSLMLPDVRDRLQLPRPGD
jgi:lysophospholipase L1-like esterase